MSPEECVALIRNGVYPDGVAPSDGAMAGSARAAGAGGDRPGGAPVWADLGSGGGAFTAALAALLGPGATIWSVDIDKRALQAQQRELAPRYPTVILRTLNADFTGDLELPPLDGMVLANSLHFQADPCAVLARLSKLLVPGGRGGHVTRGGPGGRVIIVEYDVQRANPWVPYPVPFSGLPALADSAGLSRPTLLERRPSRYHGSMYSAFLTAPLTQSI